MEQGAISMTRTLRSLSIPAILLAACVPAFAQSFQTQSTSPSTSHSSASGLSSSHSTTPTKKTSSKKHHSKREPTQKAPTPTRISEIQAALSHRGYYQSTPNGKWDSNTVAAMQKFQSDNGLESSGKINALSLQKLGLGSSIAGVSAPKPVQPAPSKPATLTPSSDAAPAQPSNADAGSSLAASSASPTAAAKPPQR
jgi:peptidoglycan hydrolase-like protein with peptidoglycan-binding domain